LLLVRCN